MRRVLKRRAYSEAAALLAAAMDSADLCEDLTPEEESEVREFIRDEIVKQLQKRGTK